MSNLKKRFYYNSCLRYGDSVFSSSYELSISFFLYFHLTQFSLKMQFLNRMVMPNHKGIFSKKTTSILFENKKMNKLTQ